MVRRRFGFGNDLEISTEGYRGGLCLAWNGNSLVSLRSYSSHFINVDILVKDDDSQWRFTEFYGTPYGHDREESWTSLKALWSPNVIPWMVCGDFNEVMYSSEKRGGVPREEKRMEAFQETLQ